MPQLPNPKDLQPFPTICSMVFKGHTNMVRSLSLEPGGQFLASGSEDGTVKSEFILVVCHLQFAKYIK